jgi:hypothetical protein
VEVEGPGRPSGIVSPDGGNPYIRGTLALDSSILACVSSVSRFAPHWHVCGQPEAVSYRPGEVQRDLPLFTGVSRPGRRLFLPVCCDQTKAITIRYIDLRICGPHESEGQCMRILLKTGDVVED